MLKRVQHDNRVGRLFCHPELVSGSHFWWVGEALASLFKATEVAPTPTRDYSADAVHPHSFLGRGNFKCLWLGFRNWDFGSLHLIVHQFAGIGSRLFEEDILVSFSHRPKRSCDFSVHLKLFDGIATDHNAGNGLGQGITEEVFRGVRSEDLHANSAGKAFHSQNSHPFGLGFRKDFSGEGRVVGFGCVDWDEYGIEGEEVDGSRENGWIAVA